MSIRSILRFLIPLFAIIFLLRTCYAIQLSREKSKQTGVSSSTTTTDNTNTVVYGGNAQNEGIAGGMPGAPSVPSSYDNGNFAAKSGEVRKSSEAVLEEVKRNKSVTEVPALSNGADDLSSKSSSTPKVSSNTSSDDIFSTSNTTPKTSYSAKLSAKSSAASKSVTKKHHATKVIKKSSKGFLVLAGSFKDHAHAEEQLEKLQKMGYKNAEIVKFEKTDFETVCVAKFNTEGSAKKLDAELEKAKIDAYVHAKK